MIRTHARRSNEPSTAEVEHGPCQVRSIHRRRPVADAAGLPLRLLLPLLPLLSLLPLYCRYCRYCRSTAAIVATVALLPLMPPLLPLTSYCVVTSCWGSFPSSAPSSATSSKITIGNQSCLSGPSPYCFFAAPVVPTKKKQKTNTGT